MLKYKTRRMLKNDVRYLQQELAKKEAELVAQCSLTGTTLSRVDLLTIDRQATVDAFWLQKQRSYFAFKLQTGLVLCVFVALSLLGVFAAFQAYGVGTVFCVTSIFTAASVVALVLLACSIKEPSDHVVLASGETVTISAEAQEQYRQDIQAMVKS